MAQMGTALMVGCSRCPALPPPPTDQGLKHSLAVIEFSLACNFWSMGGESLHLPRQRSLPDVTSNVTQSPRVGGGGSGENQQKAKGFGEIQQMHRRPPALLSPPGGLFHKCSCSVPVFTTPEGTVKEKGGPGRKRGDKKNPAFKTPPQTHPNPKITPPE